MFHLRTFLLAGLIYTAGSLPASADIAPIPSCEVTVDDSPADGAEEIPLNPMLLYTSVAPFDCEEVFDPYSCDWMPELSLTDEEGTVVALTAEFVTDHCVLVFFPDEDLEPNSAYHVLHEEERLATFTTGSAADLQAPAFTASLPEPSTALSIEYTSDEPLVLATVTLYRDEGSRDYGVTPGESTLDLCSYTNPDQDGDYVHVSVYDAAGNWAGTHVTIDRGMDDDDDGEPESCACTHDDATAVPAALLACCGLAALVWVRRRRSDRD